MYAAVMCMCHLPVLTLIHAPAGPAPIEVPTEAPTEGPTAAPIEVPTEAPIEVPAEGPTPGEHVVLKVFLVLVLTVALQHAPLQISWSARTQTRHMAMMGSKASTWPCMRLSVYHSAVAPGPSLDTPILSPSAMGPAPGIAPLQAPFLSPGLGPLPATAPVSAPRPGPRLAPLALLAPGPEELTALAPGALALALCIFPSVPSPFMAFAR